MKKNLRPIIAGIALASAFATGCGDSNNDFIVTQQGLNGVAPTAQADAFNALGNTTLQVNAAEGLLANDAVNGATASGSGATTQNGTVTINADGSFTYDPAVGFTGADTFEYTLTNSFGTSTATATITTNQLFWYVDNTAGAAGTGAFGTPFNTLAAAVNAAGNNETIFVRAGDGSSTGLTGPVTLKPGQTLIGETSGLNLDNVLPQQIIQPGTRPSLVGPIELVDGVTLEGLRISASATAPGATGTLISDVTIRDTRFQSGALEGITVSLDGSVTMSESVVDGGSFIFDGNNVATLNSTDNIWIFGGLNLSALLGRNNGQMTFNSTRDVITLQMDAADNSRLTSTITDPVGGSPSLTGSTTGEASATLSGGQLSNFQLGFFGNAIGSLVASNCQIFDQSSNSNDAATSVTATLTDCTIQNLSTTGNGTLTLAGTRVSGGAMTGNWMFPTGSITLTDCDSSFLNLGVAGCLESTGGTFTDVLLDAGAGVVNLANFQTNNTVTNFTDNGAVNK